MNDGVISIDFEVGYPIGTRVYGTFTGRAEVDHDGNVVEICLDALYKGDPDATLQIPSHGGPYDETESFSRRLALQIECQCADKIKDALDEWHVSFAEKEWGPRTDRDEHSTLRAVRGRVA